MEQPFDRRPSPAPVPRPPSRSARGTSHRPRHGSESRSARAGRRVRSNQRRSPGPPGAGSAGWVTKASWDSVSDRRGTASRVTVTRISRRGARVPKTTTRAAPAAAPRTRPRAMKASSLAVTRCSSSSSPTPPGAPSPGVSVAARHARVNFSGGPAAARSGRPGCRAGGPGGRLTPPVFSTRVARRLSYERSTDEQRFSRALTLDVRQEFLVQPVDASWLQCNIECQEACPVGTNCRGYLNLAAEGRFEEGYILSREPNPVAAMCSYVCSAPCERACRRGDIDRPLAIRAMKRFLVEWHEASGIPDVMPHIEAQAGEGRGRGRRTGRNLGRARARHEGLRRRRLRQPAVRRRHDAHRRSGVPPPARGDRDGHPPRRAARGEVPLLHQHRRGHHLRGAPGERRCGRDHGRRDERRGPRRPGRGPRGRAVRRRLHEEGQPRRADRGRQGRRRHRRWLHRDGLLADLAPARRGERRDRLPPDAVRAGRRRGGARRDRARGRPDGVPREPGRGPRRGRPRDRRQVHPQQARRAGRLGPPLAGAHPRLGVRDQGGHGHPGGLPGGRPDVPAGRGGLRGQPRPGQGRPRDVRDERPRRLRLRRLRDRPDDADRGGRPRQEVRVRDRPVPRRADRRDGRGEREDDELVDVRDARVLRRPARASTSR